MPVTQPTSREAFVARATLVAWWIAAACSVVLAVRMVREQPGMDAHAYWLAGREPLVYGRAPGQVDAFLYSPVFADVVRPFSVLPWPVFWALWAGLETVALWWLLRPIGLRWALPLFVICLPELEIGNVYLLVAACAVLGLRRPVAWGFPLLTKVTLGVGLLWFAFRGEWGRLAGGVALIGAAVSVSYLLQPDAWRAWAGLLVAGSGGSWDGKALLIARCVCAVALVLVAARTDRPWLIAVALVVGNPMPGWMALTMLTAIPRLRGRPSPGRPRSESTPAALPDSARSTP